MRRVHRLGKSPAATRRERRHAGGSRLGPDLARCAGRRHPACGVCPAEPAGQRQDQHRHQRRLHQIGRAPADPRHAELHERRRDRAGKAVGRLDDRDRHAAPAHEMARQQRHEHDEPQAIRADRHHHPVEHDDLPEAHDKGAAEQAQHQKPAAEQQQQPARPQPVDQRPDKRRADPATSCDTE